MTRSRVVLFKEQTCTMYIFDAFLHQIDKARNKVTYFKSSPQELCQTKFMQTPFRISVFVSLIILMDFDQECVSIR